MKIKQHILDLEKELTLIKERLARAKYELAQQECPHKIGDIITINRAGRKIIVDAISAPKYSFYGDWMCSGRVIKKDGTPGLNMGEKKQM